MARSYGEGYPYARANTLTDHCGGRYSLRLTHVPIRLTLGLNNETIL